MKLSRLQADDLPLVPRWSLRLLAAAGSLQLAVVLIATLAGVLAWATLVESRYGAAAAHSGIYDTGWFTAIGVLLAVNVLCAVLIRFPWRRRQTGFVVTHAGHPRVAGRLPGDPAVRRRGPVADLRGPRRPPGLPGFGPGRSGPRLPGLPAPISAKAGPRRRHGLALFEPRRFPRPRRPAEKARRKTC